MCDKLFLRAAEASSLDAPILAFPECHRKAHINVFVDVNRQTIILSCSKCDQILDTIKRKHDKRTGGKNAIVGQ